MKHTNENLASRDDDYISKLVNIIELKKAGHDAEMWQMTTFKDYCNDPSAIMPIAIENKISLDWFYIDSKNKIAWSAVFNDGDNRYRASNVNPYRAICECYILMNQGDV